MRGFPKLQSCDNSSNGAPLKRVLFFPLFDILGDFFLKQKPKVFPYSEVLGLQRLCYLPSLILQLEV